MIDGDYMLSRKKKNLKLQLGRVCLMPLTSLGYLLQNGKQFGPLNRFDEECVDAGSKSLLLGISAVQSCQGCDDQGPGCLADRLSHLSPVLFFDATNLSGGLEAVHDGHRKV